uniref:50S ribosomal protein L35 n=1 Tax=Cyanophora biloba TaxID=1489483 RepID=A0A2Z4HGG0_9EUKA|nr:ribosomal protein L35 [Cyanophora biloba]AWW13876.1 ribosomal protein L35 [Cyanophora biloba]
MYKLKTRKAASKRYKAVGDNKKISRRKAFKSHLLQKKSTNRKRQLSQTVIASPGDTKKIYLMLPYL